MTLLKTGERGSVPLPAVSPFPSALTCPRVGPLGAASVLPSKERPWEEHGRATSARAHLLDDQVVSKEFEGGLVYAGGPALALPAAAAPPDPTKQPPFQPCTLRDTGTVLFRSKMEVATSKFQLTALLLYFGSWL